MNYRLSEREKSLQNAINAMYRFESDLKDYALWLTKVDVVLNRYTDLTSDPATIDPNQCRQITDSLRVSKHRDVRITILDLEHHPDPEHP